MGEAKSLSWRVAYSIFGLGWLFQSWPWLSGQVTIPYDAKALFQAQLQFLSTALHSGQSPFWNPYTFVGFPQISDPQSLIFSPALLLAILFDSPTYNVLDTYVMLLLGLGGAAVVELCRDKGWHPGGAVVGGIAFAFGGSAAWRIQHIGHIQSYVFFAIALWCLLRALDRRSLAWGMTTGGMTGLMLIEPDQMALLGAYSLAIVGASHVLMSRSPREAFASLWKIGLVAVLTAVIVSAVPIVLTYLFMQQSNRPSINMAEAARGSLHPASLLTFLVADLFGALDPNVGYWGPYSTHWNKDELTLSQNMCQVYSGVLPAILILTIGLIRGHLLDRAVRPFTIILAFSVIYSIGTYSPGYYAFYNLLPGVQAFRRPVDGTFLLGAMIAILSGYFVHLWLTFNIKRISYRGKLGEIAFVSCIIIMALAVAVMLHKSDVAWRPLLFSIGWLSVATVLLQIPDPWIRRGTTAMIVVPGLFLSLDLRVNNAANASTGVNARQVADVLKPQSTNETITFLKSNVRRNRETAWRDRVELVGLGFDWQNCASVHRLENTLGYNPFRIGLVSRALGARDYNVGVDQRTFSPLFPSYRSVLADMLGMRFIASGAPLEAIDRNLQPGDFRLVRRTAEAHIYENPRVLPRALLAGHALAADFNSILVDGKWPAFDPKHTVLLSPSDWNAIKLPAAPSAQGDEPASSDQVSIERYDHTIIEFKTNAIGRRVLVINDIWHPWWFASVDGHDAHLMQANAIFRAVAVPAGTHTVKLEFKPIDGMWRELRMKESNRH